MRLILIEKALSQYGITEIKGDKSNPEINKYFNEIGQTWADDEVSWCSAFVNWVCKTENFEYSGKLTARSWLDIGTTIITPKLGNIVILWREDPDSWKGHVGFFVREDKNNIWVLGGNQSNTVNISSYPKERLLKYIKPNFIADEK